MVFKLLGEIIEENIDTKILIYPFQGDEAIYGINIYETEFDISKLSPSLLNNTIGIFQIDVLNKKVLKIDQHLTSQFVIGVERERLIKQLLDYNKIIAAKNPNMRKTNEIPNDLSIKQIIWDLAVATIEIEEYPLFLGPKGSGKTSTVIALGKYMGYEVFPVNCATLFKPKSALVGNIHAKDGNTFMIESEFLKYFTSDKKILIFLNELSRIPSAASNYMMAMLDRIQSYLPVEDEARRVYKGENVLFIADANIGIEYTDARTSDGAFLDRFVKYILGYLSEEEEIKILMQRVPNANPAIVKKLVNLANLCRSQVDTLMVSASARQLISMSKLSSKGFTFNEIKEHVFKNIFIVNNTSDTEAIDKIFDSIS